jgi:DivIVA domain-containing protein
MSSENYSDALPILTDRGFDTAMRGYDRRQVDEYVANLDDEVRAATADRDGAIARCADLAAQLASTQAQIESLRRQLRRATERPTTENVDTRVREMLDSAAKEAAKMRTDADSYVLATRRAADESAERVRANARFESEQIMAQATERHIEADETFRQRIADAERHRSEVTTQLEQDIARARAEEDQLTLEAQATRERLDAEAAAERTRREEEFARLQGEQEAALQRRIQTAEDDFEIALRLRRRDEAAKSSEKAAAAEADAQHIRETARGQADQMIHDAEDKVTRLHTRQEETHIELRALHAKIATVLAQTGPLTAAAAPPAAEPAAAQEQPVDEQPVDEQPAEKPPAATQSAAPTARQRPRTNKRA